MTTETAETLIDRADAMGRSATSLMCRQVPNQFERRIIGRAIGYALASGWSVSVYDGEDWSLKQSTDLALICHEIGATDCTTLRFRKLVSRDVVGSVFFVHGNGEDVWSDNTDNEDMERVSDFACKPLVRS